MAGEVSQVGPDRCVRDEMDMMLAELVQKRRPEY